MATTAKRREQNRQAQARFRLRRKERQAASTAALVPAPSTPSMPRQATLLAPAEVAQLDAKTMQARNGAAGRLAAARANFEAWVGAHPVEDVLQWARGLRTPYIEKWAEPAYLRPLLRLAASPPPTLRQIAVRKGSQLGFTSGLLAIIGYGIARQQRHVVAAQPSVGDVRSFVRDSVVPMMEATDELALLDSTTMRGRKSGSHRVYTQSSLLVFNAGTAARAWRRFVADVLLLDELDALPPSIPGGTESEGEGDPIALAARPLRTRRGLLVAGGTPTGAAGPSRIIRMAEAAALPLIYVVPCPSCGEYTDVVWERLTWANKTEPLHDCAVCGAGWPWAELPEALEAGRWVESQPAKLWPVPKPGGRWMDATGAVHDGDGSPAATPASISFSIWSGYSGLVPWADFVQQWLEAQGDPNAAQVFTEQCLAREHEHEREQAEAPELKAKAAPIEVPPPAARVAIVGVDVQKQHVVAVLTWWAEPQRCWITDRREFHGEIDDGEAGAWLALTGWLQARPWKLATWIACDVGYLQTATVRALRKVSAGTRCPTRHVKGLDGPRRPWCKRSRTESGVPLLLAGTHQIKRWLIASYGKDVQLADSLPDEAYSELAAEHIEIRRHRGRPAPTWVRDGPNESFDAAVYCAATWASLHPGVGA